MQQPLNKNFLFIAILLDLISFKNLILKQKHMHAQYMIADSLIDTLGWLEQCFSIFFTSGTLKKFYFNKADGGVRCEVVV